MHPSNTAEPHGALAPATARATPVAAVIDKMIAWVGSPASLALHTVAFLAAFALSLLRLVDWNLMLLVLTTVVSLEAIYLAIFIQFSVNRQAASLKGVEEDVESIQVDVEELGEHVEGLKEDVEEIQEDVAEISEDSEEDSAEEVRKKKQAEMLESLTNDVKAMLAQLEALKGR